MQIHPALLSRRRLRRRHSHGHELWHRQRGQIRLTCQLAPAMHNVGVDAVGHRDLGHRRARLRAFEQHLLLQLGAVVPAPYDYLRCHRVQLLLTGHHRYSLSASVQDGFAAPLKRDEGGQAFTPADGTTPGAEGGLAGRWCRGGRKPRGLRGSWRWPGASTGSSSYWAICS